MATRLKTVLQQQHLQTHTAFCREYDKIAATIDPDLVGSAPRRSQFHRWLSGDVKGLPYPHHCRILEKMLPGHTATELFQPETTGRQYNAPVIPARSDSTVRPFGSWLPPGVEYPESGVAAEEFADSHGWLDGSRLPFLRMPAGRFFAGADIPAVVVAAVPDRGRIVAAAPTGTARYPALSGSGRSVVVAHIDDADQPRRYVMDRRRVRARLATTSPEAPLLFPRAYVLDDFTLAIIWAVTGLDSALLDDDADLAEVVGLLEARTSDPHLALGRDLGAELSPVSRMWLGSEVCARHILRNADTLTDTPQFWSREQRGEEASTWLLFGHKYRYLHATSSPDSDRPVRAFCVPPAAVHHSGRPERILLLLAAVLHESTGVTTVICSEPEYTTTPGFVLDRNHRALVANWVNTDRIWQVDVTDRRPTLREFDDAIRWARSRTVLPGASPRDRLQALADYLDLDWSWLVRRATEFADSGIAGLCAPRSRLLSTAGLDQACTFLSSLDAAGR
ncbi:hypothetical protein [Nocardia sienata]|uniref:hypothetical protein n=1 Tax=Nocardia sienata TaxID=248552 RepID=UPI0007A5192A|nr:hypothetical protein [Nocardia sienata]